MTTAWPAGTSQTLALSASTASRIISFFRVMAREPMGISVDDAPFASLTSKDSASTLRYARPACDGFEQMT